MLNNLGFVITDTPRSYVYFQVLKANNLLPNYFIYLQNHNHKKFPENKINGNGTYSVPREYQAICGKKINIKMNLLKELEKLKIDFNVYKTTNIHNSYVIKKIKSRAENFFLYSGYSGVILKKKILDTQKNFLHIHGGYLPAYKGSTTNYYSILNEKIIGASAIFINEKIDSGQILLRSKFKVPTETVEIDNFHDSLIRAIVLLKTLKKFYKHKKWPLVIDKKTKEDIYYIIHPLLKHIAILTSR